MLMLHYSLISCVRLEMEAYWPCADWSSQSNNSKNELLFLTCKKELVYAQNSLSYWISPGDLCMQVSCPKRIHEVIGKPSFVCVRVQHCSLCPFQHNVTTWPSSSEISARFYYCPKEMRRVGRNTASILARVAWQTPKELPFLLGHLGSIYTLIYVYIYVEFHCSYTSSFTQLSSSQNIRVARQLLHFSP